MAGDQDLTVKKEPQPKRERIRADLFWGLAVVVLALVLRLLYQMEIRHHPLTRHLFLDPAFYDRWARSIAAGDWLSCSQGIFYGNPLYPYFLAVIYSVFGHTLLGVHLIQSLLGSATCLMLFLIGRRVFDSTAGILAGLMAALYAPLIFYESTLTIATLGLFLSTLVVCLLVAGPGPTVGRSLGAGVIWGLRALARFDATIIAALAWLLGFGRDRPIGRSLLLALLFCLGTCLAVLPVTARNYLVGGKPVITTAHGGETFYAGNNPRARGVYAPERGVRPGTEFEHEDFRLLASQRVGRELSLEESSSYWFRQGLEYIRRHPLSWLRLELRKLLLFWGPREIPDNRNFHYFRQFSTILRLPLVEFAILCPLALLGLVVGLGTWRRSALLYLQVIFSMLSVLFFFVSSRYRLPTAPFLILFAAYGLIWSWRRLRKRRWGSLVVCWLPALALLIFMMRQARGLRHESFEARRETLAVALVRDGRVDDGIAELRDVIDLAPGRITAHFNLGVVYLEEQSRLGLAAREFHAVIRLQDDYPRAHYMLGKVYREMGQWKEATEEFHQELDLWPRDAAVRLELGLAYVQRGEGDRAEEQFRLVIAQQPGNPAAHRSLGNVLYLQSRLEEAAASWQRALELNPGDDLLQENLEKLRGRLGSGGAE